MAIRKHVIIGCGSAALAAIDKIRTINQQDEIEVYTREIGLPYSPTALPYLLAGRIKEADLSLRDETYFKERQCSLIAGQEAVQVQPGEKQVGFRDGSSVKYDTLLIATGAEPLKPSLEGLAEVGFRGFHTLEDYRELAAAIDGGKDITIYGGGLVAVEVAAALLERKCRARLVVRSRLLRMYFDQECGGAIESVLKENGAEIVPGEEIRRVEKSPGGVRAWLTGGKAIDTSLFLCCTGVAPRVSFLKGSGIKMNGEVAVDSTMATSARDVYAAGDIAEAADFFSGKPVLYPILPLAVAQGEVAGSNMAGEKLAYGGSISTNIFRFFGNTAFSAGLTAAPAGDGKEFHDFDGKRKYKRFLFQGDRLVGVMTFNVLLDPGVMLYLIREKVNVGPHQKDLFENPLDVGRWLMLNNERPVGVR